MMNKAREEVKDDVDEEHAVSDIRRVFQYSINNVECRRVQVLRYFDEQFNQKDCRGQCDNCKDTSEVVEEDLTETAHALVRMAISKSSGGQRITRSQLIDQASKDINNGLSRCTVVAKKDRLERIFDHLYEQNVLGLFMATGGGDLRWNNYYLEVTSIIGWCHHLLILSPMHVSRSLKKPTNISKAENASHWLSGRARKLQNLLRRSEL